MIPISKDTGLLSLFFWIAVKVLPAIRKSVAKVIRVLDIVEEKTVSEMSTITVGTRRIRTAIR